MSDFGLQLERIVSELVSGLLATARVAGLEHQRRRLETLQKAVAWQRELEAGIIASKAAIARREGLSLSAVAQIMRLVEDLEMGDDLESGRPPASPVSSPSLPIESNAHDFAVPAKSRKTSGYRDLRRDVLLRFDTQYISELLAAARNNVSLAARMARIDRKHLWRLIQRTRVRGGRPRRR